MTYLLQVTTSLVQVADGDVDAYVAAGYRLPTASEIVEHLAHDPYAGTQGVPFAPSLTPVPEQVAPAPPTPTPTEAPVSIQEPSPAPAEAPADVAPAQS